MIEIINIAKWVFKIAVVVLLVMASREDLRNKAISTWYLVAGGVLSFLFGICEIATDRSDVANMLMGLIPGVLMILLTVVTISAIGVGDGLMMLAIGPVLGARAMSVAVMIAFLLSALCCVILLTFKKISVKGRLAFMPFLTAGVGVMCFAAA